MSLGGLIPIGGGGGGGGAKKANELTSGLISISAPKGGGGGAGGGTGGDLDMSDFDVDDLLSDTGGAKSKAKASPTSKESKAKKKSSSSKTKDKDKSASSSKKKSSKKKQSAAALDDSADNDASNDWGGGNSKSKPSKWSLDDDSSEFDAAPPVKKKGNLDAEFAKMLGLDDDFGADSSMASAMHADNEGDGDDGVGAFSARGGGGDTKSELFGSSNKEDESGVSSFSYEPRVRGAGKGRDKAGASSIFDDAGGSGAKSYSDPFAARADGASKSSGGGRGDARDTTAAESAAAEAVGGLGASFFRDDASGGGRGQDADADDPFGGSSLSFLSSTTSERRGGRGGGRRGGGVGSSALAVEDPFASTGGSRRSANTADPFRASADAEKTTSTLDSLFGGSREKRKEPEDLAGANASERAEAAAIGSANAGGRRQPQPQPRANDGDLFTELFPSEPAASLTPTTKVSPTRDLMTELFPSEPAASRANKPAKAERSDPEPSTASPTTDKSSRSAKDDLLADLLPPKPGRSPPALDKDTRSAKDDLLAELSPPKKPSPPAPDRSAKDDLLAELSPGSAKTLVSPPANSIKEADFEQSKDSLLEELLTPSKSPPPSPSRRGSSPRRNSYSQSFEGDEEPPTAAESPRRSLRSSSAVVSPSPSPVKAHVETRDHHSPSPPPAPSPSPPSPAKSVTTPPPPLAAAPEARRPPEVSTELLEAALRKRDDELRAESDAARAALLEAHSSEVATLTAAIRELRQQLGDAHAARQTLAGELEARASLSAQEKALLLQQLASLQTERLQLQQELHAVRTQHAACEAQSALFASERAGFLSQAASLEEQSRQLAQRVGQEKQAHQATQLAFASFRQEAEQAAGLQKQQETHHMRTLFQQLQTSLASLRMLQEQVAGDELTKHEVESEARLRMIATLETSSRRSARQSEDECVRLAGLLSSLEATLRHARQEQLEEKERLRQEQLRLGALAAHFQAQSSVLHEAADANAQLLATHLGASLQDARVAESRLAARRQTVEDGEKQLYDERARFAAYREDVLQQQARAAHALQAERRQFDQRWQQLERERADLDAVIASHEDAFQRLQAQRCALADEREGVASHAQQVADAARRFEAFTQQIVAREGELAAERQELERRTRELGAQQQSAAAERHALDERELRLRSQFRQMEKARQQLHGQRKELLAARVASGNPLAAHDLDQAKQRLLAHTRSMGGRAADAPVDNNRKWRASSAAAPEQSGKPTWAPAASDPSGLSPAFRQLVEDNWKAREWNAGGGADAALRKERMWISCIGLDTRAPVSGGPRSSAASVARFAPTSQLRMPPPSSSTASLPARRAVTIDL